MSFPVTLSTPQWYRKPLYNQSQRGAPQGSCLFADGVNFYFVTQATIAAVGGNTLIYKVTDGTNPANSWIQIVDDSNRAGNSISTCVFGTVIYLVVNNSNGESGSNLALYRFDMSTDTWLADHEDGPNIIANSDLKVLCAALSDGTIAMVYNTPPTSVPGTLQLLTWKADVWSTPADIQVSSTLWPQWILKENTTDRVHVFLNDITTSEAQGDIYHVSIESDGTVNTIQQLTSTGNPFYAVDCGGPCITSTDSQIIVPWTKITGELGGNPFASPIRELRTLRATPAANPTWTDELVQNSINVCSLAALGFFPWPLSYSVAFGSVITINFFTTTFPTGPPYGPTGWQSEMYTVQTTSLSGGWGTPTVLYTEIPDTVMSGKYDALLSTGYGIMFMSTQMGDFETSGSEVASLTDRFFWFGPSSGPVLINCIDGPMAWSGPQNIVG